MSTEIIQKLLEQYNQGLEQYKLGQFPQAIEFFEKALAIKPDDGPSRMYIQRCKDYIESPPPPDWDGVYVMKTK